MGNCFKSPIDKVTIDIETDVEGNESNCCNQDSCPSTCCYINIYRAKSKENIHK